jgi:hypothetical protein
VGQRGKDDFCLIERCVLGGDVNQVASANPSALAPLLIRRCECEVQAWVLGDKTTQLPAGIPARAEDSHRNFMHKECITLHSGPVNDPAVWLAHRLAPC